METLVDLFEHVIRDNPPERELLRTSTSDTACWTPRSSEASRAA